MKLENDGDCIIWPAKLVSYIVRCSTHKVWDCSDPACAKDISDRMDKLIRERLTARLEGGRLVVGQERMERR